jgi:hypothetical protein
MAYWNAGGAVIDRAGDADWNAPVATPSLVPAFPSDTREPSRHPRPGTPSLPRCPEIDCVRHLLPPGLTAIAELASREEVLETLGMAVYMGAGPSVLYATYALDAFAQFDNQKATTG